MTSQTDMFLDIAERAQRRAKSIDRLEKKLEAERVELEIRLCLADALALLRELPAHSMSEGNRIRAAGLKKRIKERLAA
jgi:hypothetical protein